MSIIDKIKAKAKQDVKHIVLAEGSEPRTSAGSPPDYRSGDCQGDVAGQYGGYC